MIILHLCHEENQYSYVYKISRQCLAKTLKQTKAGSRSTGTLFMVVSIIYLLIMICYCFQCLTVDDILSIYQITSPRITQSDVERLCPALLEQHLSGTCAAEEEMKKTEGPTRAESKYILPL